uniref:Uncharacterized protein n=2 Tax=Meloidogyne enterolobii TaxID=390850 RepID=A0A6V7UVU9_MELEN|nr:unnamed protein product [Meloidogyne enterolobii]
MTVSLLYEKVKNSFEEIKKESGNVKKLIPANTSKLEALSDRLKWLKAQLFANEKSFYTSKSLCLMVNFIQMATPEKLYEANKKLGYKQDVVDLNEVRNWEGKECDNNVTKEDRKIIFTMKTV